MYTAIINRMNENMQLHDVPLCGLVLT